jgi:nitrite reductase/ring-hydroxylating ferredoxin subunit
MSYTKVARISQLEPGWVVEVQIKGRPYALCNVDGKVYCLGGECACTGGPLGFGRMQDGKLVCPWHGWRYDHRTGVMEYDESISIPTYPVKLAGDDIYVDAGSPRS